MLVVQHRIKQNGTAVLEHILKEKDVEVVCLNRKERRKVLQGRDSMSCDSSNLTLPQTDSRTAVIEASADERMSLSESSIESTDELEDGELKTSESEGSDEDSCAEETAIGVEGIFMLCQLGC